MYKITATPSSVPPTVTASGNPGYRRLAAEFPLLFDNRQGTYSDHQHAITVSSNLQPHIAKLRPVAFVKHVAVTAEVQSMIDSRIWSPKDKSECAHAMVVVVKKDGGVQITLGLSSLHKFVLPDRRPMPPHTRPSPQVTRPEIFLQTRFAQGLLQ